MVFALENLEKSYLPSSELTTTGLKKKPPERIAQFYAQLPNGRASYIDPWDKRITYREAVVVYLSGFGLSRREVAKVLCLGDGTIIRYFHLINKKLGVRGITHAYTVMWRRGYIAEIEKSLEKFLGHKLDW